MSGAKPFWQTLKWMLSVLMVLLFFLEKISLSTTPLYEFQVGGFEVPLTEIMGSFLEGSLLGLNIVLIPMFIFIAAYLTQDQGLKEIRQSLLPAVITYSAFQLINTIPLLFAGHFSWEALLLFPLDGVWFILAVPVWQWLSLCLLPFKRHIILKGALFLLLLYSGYWAFYNLLPVTGFALVIGYFPIFYLGRQVSAQQITTWRAMPWGYFLGVLLVTLLLFVGSYSLLPMSRSLMNIPKLPSTIAILNYLLFMLFSILLGMILIYLIRYLKLLENIAPKALGIYLIHPIICTGLLAILHYYGITIDFLLAGVLTLITVTIALGLASIWPFKWLLSPKFS